MKIFMGFVEGGRNEILVEIRTVMYKKYIMLKKQIEKTT